MSVFSDHADDRMRRRYQQPRETIGRCECCGLVDHHLIAGECPSCRKPRHPVITNRTTSDFFALKPSSPAPEYRTRRLLDEVGA